MRAVICYCEAAVAKSLEALLAGAGLKVIEVEPEMRSSSSGKLLRVSEGNRDLIVSVSYYSAKPTSANLESRIVIYLPWKWKDYLLGRDPYGALGLTIRSILDKQTIGRVAFHDHMTRAVKTESNVE